MPPQDEDLADVIFSSEPLSLSDLGQVSNDSEYTDHKKISEGIHQVYWKPKKGEVKIAKPYKHHIRTHYPISIKPVYKSMTIPFAAKTIRFQLSAQSNIPIEKIVVFRGSRFFNVKNSDKIASRAEKIRWKRAPLPKIVGNNFTWNLTNIEPGTTYFVVVFLKS